MCSGFASGSHLRLIDFVHHSTLGLRVTKGLELRVMGFGFQVEGSGFEVKRLRIRD